MLQGANNFVLDPANHLRLFGRACMLEAKCALKCFAGHWPGGSEPRWPGRISEGSPKAGTLLRDSCPFGDTETRGSSMNSTELSLGLAGGMAMLARSMASMGGGCCGDDAQRLCPCWYSWVFLSIKWEGNGFHS